MAKRYLTEDKETGLTVSVPEDRLEYFRKQQESPQPLSEETRAKLEEAGRILKARIYGK